MKSFLIFLACVTMIFAQNNVTNYNEQKIEKLEKIFTSKQRIFEFGEITIEQLLVWHKRLYKAKYENANNLKEKLAVHTKELDFYKEMHEIVAPSKDSFLVSDILILDLSIFEVYSAYEKTFEEHTKLSFKKQEKYENLVLKMDKLVKSLSIESEENDAIGKKVELSF